MGTIIILDTSAVIEILKSTEKASKMTEEFFNEDIGISTFTIYELLWARMHDLDIVERIAKRFKVFDFGKEQSIASAKIRSELSRKGSPINEVDIFIASTTMAEKAVLVTCDKDFEKITGLNVRIF